MIEIFKDIPGFEGYYQASDQGRMKSVERKGRRKERILKPGIDSYGYLYVYLYKNGKRKTLKVHRLILLTFEGPSDLQTNHKNCIKTDNRLENLEYVTNLENMTHARKNGLFKNIQKQVSQLNLLGDHIRSFVSMHEADRQTGISFRCISQCCHGRYKTAGGFKWRII